MSLEKALVDGERRCFERRNDVRKGITKRREEMNPKKLFSWKGGGGGGTSTKKRISILG